MLYWNTESIGFELEHEMIIKGDDLGSRITDVHNGVDDNKEYLGSTLPIHYAVTPRARYIGDFYFVEAYIDLILAPSFDLNGGVRLQLWY